MSGRVTMAEHSILAGQIYDLRSPGEVERECPPRLYEVVEVMSSSVFDDHAIRCRSIPLGGIRDWPLRRFTQAKLVSAPAPVAGKKKRTP